MLRNAWFIAVKDVQYTLREKEALVWLFVMPIVFFYFIGTVTGGFGGGGGAGDEIALREAGDSGFLVDRVARRLEERELDPVRVGGDEAEGHARVLRFPAGFTDRVLAGEPTTLRYEREAEEGDLQGDYDDLRVGRAIYTVLAEVVAAAETGEQPGPEAFEALDAMPRALELDVRPAGKRQSIPTGFEQAIPGILVMFTLLVLLTSGAVMLVIERNQGLLRRLASAPISRGELVLGKWGGKMALGLVQIAFAMLAGTVLFGMDWGPDLPMIFLVLLGWGALCASLGLLLGSLVRTEGQAIGVGVLAANVLAALGGCWWPIEITPGWMQSFAGYLPTGWAMGAMHDLVSFQSGAASAAPQVAILFGAAVVVGWGGVRFFRYE